MKPVHRVIQAFGKQKLVAEAAGKTATTVNRWKRVPDDGGTDGYIPIRDAERLLEQAARDGVPLTYADFFNLSPEAHAHCERIACGRYTGHAPKPAASRSSVA